jgi:Fe-Mn family superoxide dismutase
VVQHRLEGKSLEELLTQDLLLPTVQADRVRNAAGAVYNHELYFDSLQNHRETPPLNRLVGVLITVYGSLSRFKRLLVEAAEGLPGSGWIWLVIERNGGPHIVVTQDNEVVSLHAVQPIFTVDLWEHAYFLDYQFNKEAYLDTWFSFLNWEKAEARFLSAAYQ